MEERQPISSLPLDPVKVSKILEPEGILERNLKGYEYRQEQQQMLLNALDAYNKDQIALIEAGTGTGKSLAYLIPALLWAVKRNERTVISTKTINLQEQILLKDIPLLEKALNVTVKAVLVKGMQNYLCIRKLEELMSEVLLLAPEEAAELKQIESWAYSTKDGSRSSLNVLPSMTMWEKLCAEYDTCLRNDCPHFQNCHFFKARNQAKDAHLLIVNHHLLFADLSTRDEERLKKDACILPEYQRIVLDEAHHIEEIATEFFGARLSQLYLFRLLGRLASEKDGKMQGKIPLLRQKVQDFYRKKQIPYEVTNLMTRFNIDLPTIRRDLQKLIVDFFDSLNQFIQSQTSSSEEEQANREQKLRLLPAHLVHPDWQTDLLPRVDLLMQSLQSYQQMIESIDVDLGLLKDDKLDEHLRGVRFEVRALVGRLKEMGYLFKVFFKENCPKNKVRWLETQLLRIGTNTLAVDAELDVSKSLVDFLFRPFSTIVMCSATLSTNHQFDFIRQRLGLNQDFLPDREITEHVYESPFNYSKQALLVGPSDIAYPHEPKFLEQAIEQIWQAIEISRGNAFVLFTSYSMLKQAYSALYERLVKHRYIPMRHGEDSRQNLLERFKKTNRSVLFATDSFWEGVDVAGEALRCVIIVKLPFRVPTEPIVQARTELILERGGDPFYEYTLPSAVVKFKQGFGRLIRHKKDRGCIICLDKRLFTKSYGKMFLNSLPYCQQVFASSELIYQQMLDFYKKTHHLTK